MRLTNTAIALMLALGGVAYPELASAQDRNGIWFGAGLGYNSVAFGCANCDERVTDVAPYGGMEVLQGHPRSFLTIGQSRDRT